MLQNSFGSQTRRKQKTVVAALRVPVFALIALDLVATSRSARAEDIDGSWSLTVDSDPAVSAPPSLWDVDAPLNSGVTAGSDAKITIQNGGEVTNTGRTIGGNSGSHGTVAAGNSPSTLTIDGDLDLTSASVMDFELGSPSGTAGVDSDLIRLWLSLSDFLLSRDRSTCNA
ncbi:hypothetical protein SAMN04488518_1411 [Pseudovibrio ascidiaceicola]|uniref:Uncharacterized protein n=1 Tax=Pseudovibrio ascidiaceicola TaxID=285279 RepID=A0A1I4GBG7_9HYPH|nr:hypothetical protein [Pseudovibrio ascidiaceicola]SFL27199.1 hypothetical protein SAMN04488518_1411 [Pseudovibrio ascidiaceicola]